MVKQIQASQIVCLEQENRHLYGEVIQVIPERNLCWVRPLMLAIDFKETEKLIDLRSGSDLLLPICLFRPALDTEIIPLITGLNTSDLPEESLDRVREQLNQFVREVWQTHRDIFDLHSGKAKN